MRVPVLALPVLAAVLTSGPTMPAPESVQQPAVARLGAIEGGRGERLGAIEGRLEMRATPARRKAERYLGGAVVPARAVQSIPAVVFLRGPAPGVSADAGRVRLMQRDTAFVPAVVIIGEGGTVEFPNGDPFFHNVFSYSPAQRFDLGRYPQGESKAVRFDEPGIVRIYCEVHESMRSAVIVVENPFHAIVGEQGEFVIRNVPAGRWELEVWHPDLEGQVRTITVESGRATRLTIPLS
jgi:plastocyanin